MKNLIQIEAFPVKDVLEKLLIDRTREKNSKDKAKLNNEKYKKSPQNNIIWATDTYTNYSIAYEDSEPITPELISGMFYKIIQPRVCKALEDQSDRTRKHAEVFTPSWICNKMNNYCDEEWFGRKDVFNTQSSDNTWQTNDEPITFPEGKSWQDYVDSTRLEITCGEAPFIVSRYDASTGEIIGIKNRIGLLDRKLRVINENVDNEAEWLKWVERAYQSVYGYEYQGDNLLIARINLLMTFCDYMEYKWNRQPDKNEIEKIATIISWNFWQMDGLKGTVPLGKPQQEVSQLSWLDAMGIAQADDNEVSLFEQTISSDNGMECYIKDWRSKTTIMFSELKKGR